MAMASSEAWRLQLVIEASELSISSVVPLPVAPKKFDPQIIGFSGFQSRLPPQGPGRTAFPTVDQKFPVQKNAETVVASETQGVISRRWREQFATPAGAIFLAGNSRRGRTRIQDVDLVVHPDHRWFAFKIWICKIFGLKSLHVGIARRSDDGTGKRFAIGSGGSIRNSDRIAGLGSDSVQNFNRFVRHHSWTAERVKLQMLRRFADDGNGFHFLPIQTGNRLRGETGATWSHVIYFYENHPLSARPPASADIARSLRTHRLFCARESMLCGNGRRAPYSRRASACPARNAFCGENGGG